MMVCLSLRSKTTTSIIALAVAFTVSKLYRESTIVHMFAIETSGDEQGQSRISLPDILRNNSVNESSLILITKADFKDRSFIDAAEYDGVKRVTEPTYKHDSARQAVLERLARAGLRLDSGVQASLPTKQQISELYGTHPIIYGLERCVEFRKANPIPFNPPFVAIAGQMNSGTNALFRLMRDNLRVRSNENALGILWTVPW